MFGFSIGKLLVTAIAILVVWYGFKLLTDDGKREQPRVRRRSKRAAPARPVAEDMVQCRVCAAYVSATMPNDCGREGCPYRA